jgi:hypothetical protein
MSKRDLGLLGTSRDEDALFDANAPDSESLDAALHTGALVRTKITNQWLYATSAAAVEKALEVVETEAIRRIHPWLLGAAPYLRGPIARASRGPAVTRNAAELLLRELARDRRLLTLGLLTVGYEPYLGLYAPDDAEEVSRQVDALAQTLAHRGYVRPRDLPTPRRPREADAWRSLVLRHGEFLGLGTIDNGVLRSWESLVAG